MIDLKVLIRKRGPIFQPGEPRQAVAAWLDTAKHDVATDGVGEVRRQLHAVLKHPTGNYSRHIAQRRVGLVEKVHDSGVVYGPWLAGVSRRNRATRFKGYAHWRRATQALRRRAGRIAQRRIGNLLRRLG